MQQYFNVITVYLIYNHASKTTDHKSNMVIRHRHGYRGLN